MSTALKYPIIEPGPVLFNMWGDGQISASGDAAERKYHVAPDLVRKGSLWLYADQPNVGDNVYWGYPPELNKPSEGMGGRTLDFALVNGGVQQIKGPWKTSVENMFERAGVDHRDTYLICGIVGLRRENASIGKPDTYYDVLHHDANWVLGSFHRVQRIAEAAALEHNCMVYYSDRSLGGGGASYTSPKMIQDARDRELKKPPKTVEAKKTKPWA